MTDHRPRFFHAIAGLLILVALAVRLYNVAVFPALRAPDGFGHFTYIWHLADTWQIPPAMSGWSFFHPPLYYAVMASFWNTLDGLDPVERLRAGTGLIAVLGLAHAAVVYALVRRRFPGQWILHLAAPGFLLFLPVQLYTAGYLGNESLNAVLCSISLLAGLRLMEKPTSRRAALLGLCLGLAMLTKFTALATVAGISATLGLHFLLRREVLRGARLLAIVGTVTVLVCGSFYARNLHLYGDPFQMSRETIAVQRVENIQSQGKRSLAEFLLFDPMILVRPQWPRGIALTGGNSTEFVHDALRESVWTGMFANTFFDAVGGQVLPAVTWEEDSRRAGQVLLTLAVVPTCLVLLGLGTVLSGLWRRAWSDVDALVVFTLTSSVALFVYGAVSVPMHAAIKATYLTPASAGFAFLFAHGLHLVMRTSPRIGVATLTACGALALASVTVFTLGTVVGRGYLERGLSGSVWQNAYGVIQYAGGRPEKARRHFEAAAATRSHLAQENLALLALQDGQHLESLYRLRLAAAIQPTQSIGLPEDRAAFNRMTQAEYANALGVTYYALGWLDSARSSFDRALALDDSIPEIHYDLGFLDLHRSLASANPRRRLQLATQARDAFTRAIDLDPNFEEARERKRFAASVLGECDAESDTRPRHPTWNRLYPVETGSGDLHAAALRRRRFIEIAPATLPGASEAPRCGVRQADVSFKRPPSATGLGSA